MYLLVGTVIVVDYNLRYLPFLLEYFEKSGAFSCERIDDIVMVVEIMISLHYTTHDRR